MAARTIRSLTLVLLPLLVASTLAAQQLDRFPSPKPPAGPTPSTADGKPDFSGVWLQPRTVERGMPEMLPSASSLFKHRLETNLKDLPSAQCLPTGVFLLTPVLNKIVQTERVLVVLQEVTAGFRQVFLDGRGHPRDPNPTWLGHSIGRREGDTLVVDSVGFNDKTWLSSEGYPHTEMMHVIERYRRPDLGHLETEITIEDRDTFAKPWTIKKVSALAPNEEITELVCAENNRDIEHLVGK